MSFRQLENLKNKLPLQKSLLYPLIGFITLILSIEFLLMYAYTVNTIEKNVSNISQKISVLVSNHVSNYMNIPERTNLLNVALAQDGYLNVNDREQLIKIFLKQIKHDNRLNAIYFANEKGEVVAVRANNNDYRIAYNSTPKITDIFVYSLNEINNSVEYFDTEKNYDPRTRPWYKGAKEISNSAPSYWTDIYFTITPPIALQITVASPLINEAGEVVGVFGSDVFLKSLSEYLENLDISQNAVAYIVDSKGMLIASSTRDNLLYPKNGEILREHATSSDNKIIAATSKIAIDNVKKQGELSQGETIKQNICGQNFYLNVGKYGHNEIFDWHLVIAIPESDFTSDRNLLFFILAATTFLLLVAAVLLSNKIVKWIIEPIKALNENVLAVKDGEWTKIDVQRTDILGELTHSFNEMSHKLQSYYQSLIKKNNELADLNNHLENIVNERTEKLKILSITDDLTGLYNHRYLIDFLTKRIAESKRYNLPLSLAIFDLDFFKATNDTYGHLEGNNVLIKVSECLKESLRGGDVIGRYGGEEFLLILPNSNLENAYNAAERLRLLVENLVIGDKKIKTTMSGGVAECTPCDTLENLIRKADANLYKAKAGGRNMVIKS